MDVAEWQAGNGHYLASSMQWLRLRLMQLAGQNAERKDPEGSFLERLFEGRRDEHDANADLAAQVQQAAGAREAAARMEPPPALMLLAGQLRLTPFERDVLLLCAAMELGTRIPALCAQAMGNPHAPYPSFALALALLDSPSWDALTAQRPLRLWRLIDVNAERTVALTAAPLRADERIVNYIKGLNALDERLALILRPVGRRVGASLSRSQEAISEFVLSRWKNVAPHEAPPVAVLLGTHSDAKLLVAQHAAEAMGRQLYVLGMDGLPSAASEIELLARLWQRESALLPLALYVDTQTDGAGPDAATACDRFISRAVQSESVIFAGSREPLARLGCEWFSVDVARPTPAEQAGEWASTLAAMAPEDAQKLANRLAGQFSLNTSDIRRLAGGIEAQPLDTYGDSLWDACRDRSRPCLETLAQRIEPKATWDDLVVSEDTGRMLRAIVAQVALRNVVYETWGFAERMNRGLGISALFAGESGTGKTMAAEVMANDLRLSLYRIDLSQVVSKFIGETEKNLQRVFDLMEGGGSILFFDEADALFGKRSEVRDSHDRYANIEVNYLLQRMESYTGVAILATNMKNALDTAFVRRLRFIVPFSFPSPVERRTMWQKAFPLMAPVDMLDIDRLAKLNLTGASIQNVALNAAFLAASAGSAVTMPLVLAAARTEFRKIERPVSEMELKV
jgi:ATPase family associated with various cellular activities (AAA)